MINFSVVSLLTNNADVIHELPQSALYDNVEYIVITDDLQLTSSTWNIIYEPKLNSMLPLERYYYAKYHLFDYCKNDIAIYVNPDQLIYLKLTPIVEKFIQLNFDIGIILHPLRNNIIDELNVWRRCRGYTILLFLTAVNAMSKMNVDFNKRFLVDGVSRITLRKFYDVDLDAFNLINSCRTPDVDRVDLTLYTATVSVKYSHLNYMPISESVFCCSKYMQLCEHHSIKPNRFRSLYSYPDYKYLLDRQVKCYSEQDF